MKLITIHQDDEDVTVLVDGVEVASANHDQHGFEGMELLVSSVKAVAKALGVRVKKVSS